MSDPKRNPAPGMDESMVILVATAILCLLAGDLHGEAWRIRAAIFFASGVGIWLRLTLLSPKS